MAEDFFTLLLRKPRVVAREGHLNGQSDASDYQANKKSGSVTAATLDDGISRSAGDTINIVEDGGSSCLSPTVYKSRSKNQRHVSSRGCNDAPDNRCRSPSSPSVQVLFDAQRYRDVPHSSNVFSRCVSEEKSTKECTRAIGDIKKDGKMGKEGDEKSVVGGRDRLVKRFSRLAFHTRVGKLGGQGGHCDLSQIDKEKDTLLLDGYQERGLRSSTERFSTQKRSDAVNVSEKPHSEKTIFQDHNRKWNVSLRKPGRSSSEARLKYNRHAVYDGGSSKEGKKERFYEENGREPSRHHVHCWREEALLLPRINNLNEGCGKARRTFNMDNVSISRLSRRVLNQSRSSPLAECSLATKVDASGASTRLRSYSLSRGSTTSNSIDSSMLSTDSIVSVVSCAVLSQGSRREANSTASHVRKASEKKVVDNSRMNSGSDYAGCREALSSVFVSEQGSAAEIEYDSIPCQLSTLSITLALRHYSWLWSPKDSSNRITSLLVRSAVRFWKAFIALERSSEEEAEYRREMAALKRNYEETCNDLRSDVRTALVAKDKEKKKTETLEAFYAQKLKDTRSQLNEEKRSRDENVTHLEFLCETLKAQCSAAENALKKKNNELNNVRGQIDRLRNDYIYLQGKRLRDKERTGQFYERLLITTEDFFIERSRFIEEKNKLQESVRKQDLSSDNLRVALHSSLQGEERWRNEAMALKTEVVNLHSQLLLRAPEKSLEELREQVALQQKACKTAQAQLSVLQTEYSARIVEQELALRDIKDENAQLLAENVRVKARECELDGRRMAIEKELNERKVETIASRAMLEREIALLKTKLEQATTRTAIECKIREETEEKLQQLEKSHLLLEHEYRRKKLDLKTNCGLRRTPRFGDESRQKKDGRTLKVRRFVSVTNDRPASALSSYRRATLVARHSRGLLRIPAMYAFRWLPRVLKQRKKLVTRCSNSTAESLGYRNPTVPRSCAPDLFQVYSKPFREHKISHNNGVSASETRLDNGSGLYSPAWESRSKVDAWRRMPSPTTLSSDEASVKESLTETTSGGNFLSLESHNEAAGVRCVLSTDTGSTTSHSFLSTFERLPSFDNIQIRGSPPLHGTQSAPVMKEAEAAPDVCFITIENDAHRVETAPSDTLVHPCASVVPRCSGSAHATVYKARERLNALSAQCRMAFVELFEQTYRFDATLKELQRLGSLEHVDSGAAIFRMRAMRQRLMACRWILQSAHAAREEAAKERFSLLKYLEQVETGGDLAVRTAKDANI